MSFNVLKRCTARFRNHFKPSTPHVFAEGLFSIIARREVAKRRISRRVFILLVNECAAFILLFFHYVAAIAAIFPMFPPYTREISFSKHPPNG